MHFACGSTLGSPGATSPTQGGGWTGLPTGSWRAPGSARRQSSWSGSGSPAGAQVARGLASGQGRGYVRTHLAKPGQPVEGLTIAHKADEPLRYAVAAFPGLQLTTYAVIFQLNPVQEPAADSPLPEMAEYVNHNLRAAIIP